MYKLLVVDDSNIIRRKIERCCDADKFDVVGLAQNGVEAVDMVRRLQPAVVTMDITMPRMDGIACVERIMSINPELKILVISALADIDTGILALEKGAQGFLCKPFDEGKLNTALSALVEG